MRTAQLSWLWLCLALAAGCRAEGDLDLVARDAEAEPGAPPRWVLLARSELSVPARGGDVELWFPLPRTDRSQVVQSLAVEVGPPGTYQVEDQDGERLLHVEAPSPTPVAVRALIEQVPPRGAPALPSSLADLPAAGDPAAWVEAATARGATARVVHGLALGAEGQTVPVRWPEVLVDGDWAPADRGVDRVRLGPALPHATVGGKPAEVRTSYSLDRR